MPDDAKEQVQEREIQPTDPSSTSTTDQVQNLVKALVDHYQTARREIPIRELMAMLQGRDLAGRDLELYESWLAEARTFFRDASNRDLTLTFASEWVLDNYYIIRQALQQISEDLPPGYYKQLPKLTGGPLKGLPRIYAIARGILTYQQYLLNPIDLETILIHLQDRVPLTMGELWALPIFLRYSCIETLAHELERVIHPPYPPHLPVSPPQLPGTTDLNSANQAATDDRTVANIILSLRGISEQNWNEFFEAVSRLERILRADPSGIYPRMDFKTRDLYRKEIESLSLATGREENELAEITLDLARKSSAAGPKKVTVQPGLHQVEGTLDDSLTHVGEYLLGKSRAELEERIGYHPDVKTAFKRWGFRHASFLYLGSITVITVLIFMLVALVTNLPVLLEAAAPLQRIIVFIIGLTLLVPVLTGAASLTNWVVTLRIPPHILPKLHFKEEIPPEFQTLVVIPAMITDREEVENLTRQLEMHYLRNPEPGLFFALLTDFRDSDRETLPDDDNVLNYAAASIESLNAKYKRPSPGAFNPESSHLFYLLHRKRLWNPSEGKWMGWERKRGKLHELNLLLRGAPNLSFSKITGDMGGLEALQCVRFVITLDADTVLPRGAARCLAGTLAHPLNRAKFNDTTGQVISGYTVLQPRMEIHPRSANFSWFTRIFAGDTGLDLYTRAVSDAYQDLFGEGSYVGKGIYDVDAFERSVEKRIPDNTVLSHDLLEGIMGRAGLATDITMIEDYPPSYFVQVMRQRRWIRGDWQLLPWLLHPGKFRITFSAIDRWKMVDNMLRSMLAPALVLIFGVGMLFLPELAGAWLAIILISLGIPNPGRRESECSFQTFKFESDALGVSDFFSALRGLCKPGCCLHHPTPPGRQPSRSSSVDNSRSNNPTFRPANTPE
jgi:cyclic beta-1,2-glucan synthetase